MKSSHAEHQDEGSIAAAKRTGGSPPVLELVEVEPMYVTIGDVVADKYLVERVLGAGGMGFVLAAFHIDLEERFALKFLNERFLADRDVIERFTHEAKAACRLRSEHVARVYDVGIHQGAPFIVMEHLTGRDLSTIVGHGGPMRIELAVEITMQACEALATAHRHGIIHRDIKPENLFVVEQGGLPSVKLLDFGISKVALAGGTSSSRLTGHLMLGTPCYMSPEQIRSTASADAQSDLWSLGAVLYEILSGQEPFRGPSVTEVCAAVLEQDPVPLDVLRPEIPRALADVVACCLAKDPADRYETVAELAAALLPFAPPRAIVSVERSSSLLRATRALQSDPRVSAIRPSARPGGAAVPGRKTPSGREVRVSDDAAAGFSSAGLVIATPLETSPLSAAPVSRSVSESEVGAWDGAAGRRSGRAGRGIVLATLAALVVGSAIFVSPARTTIANAFGRSSARAESGGARTSGTPNVVDAPLAQTPVAVRAAITEEGAKTAGEGTSAPSAVPPSAVVMPSVPAPPPAAAVAPAQVPAAAVEGARRGHGVGGPPALPTRVATPEAHGSKAPSQGVPAVAASAAAEGRVVPSAPSAPPAAGTVELGY